MENTKLDSGKTKEAAGRKSGGREKNVYVDSNIQAKHSKSIQNKPIVGSALSTIQGIHTSLTSTPPWGLDSIIHLGHGTDPGTHRHTLVSFIMRSGNKGRLGNK